MATLGFDEMGWMASWVNQAFCHTPRAVLLVATGAGRLPARRRQCCRPYTQRGEHGKEQDEIETSMVVRALTVMCGDLVRPWLIFARSTDSKNILRSRPVPSYRHRYAGTIVVVPVRRGLCSSRMWTGTGG